MSLTGDELLIGSPVTLRTDTGNLASLTPTGNLDSKPAQRVMDLIKAINGRGKTTFLISTHDEGIAAQCESRVEIRDGRIS